MVRPELWEDRIQKSPIRSRMFTLNQTAKMELIFVYPPNVWDFARRPPVFLRRDWIPKMPKKPWIVPAS